jgi:hypothetical protein
MTFTKMFVMIKERTQESIERTGGQDYTKYSCDCVIYLTIMKRTRFCTVLCPMYAGGISPKDFTATCRKK